MLNEELRRDALINSVSNADTLSETLERAHTTASETDDAGETILKSLSSKNRLLSPLPPPFHGTGHGKFREETPEDGIRKVHTEVDVAHGRALCVVAALGTFAYFKITASPIGKTGDI